MEKREMRKVLESLEREIEREGMNEMDKRVADGYVNDILESIEKGFRNDMEVIEVMTNMEIRDELKKTGCKEERTKKMVKSFIKGYAQGAGLGLGVIGLELLVLKALGLK